MVAWEKDTQLYLLWLCCLHRFVTNGAEKSGAEDEVAEVELKGKRKLLVHSPAVLIIDG